MEMQGIAYELLIFQLLNMALLFGMIVLIVLALLRLRVTPMADNYRLGWTLIILLFPIFGALAFLLFYPRPSTSLNNDEHLPTR
jgi:hypothetical protein